MIVVMPDARYAGAAEIEQAVFGTEPEGYEPDPTRDGTTEL